MALGQDGVVFVASEGARILGMAGGCFEGTTRDVAVVWGMWVDRARGAKALGANCSKLLLTGQRPPGLVAFAWQ